MKNVRSIFLSLFLTSLLFLTIGCDSEDDAPAPNLPQVTLEGDNIEDNVFTGAPGQTINATVNVTAPGGFNTLIIKKFVDNVEEASSTNRVTRGSTIEETFTYDFSYVIQPSDADSDLHFTFEGVDEEGLTNGTRLDVEITALPAARYTSVLLYAPLENNTSETFFSTSTGEAYSMAQVLGSTESLSAHIDFGYFYGENLGATLAAPSSYPLPQYGQANWVVRNTTSIGRTTLTAGQYVEISVDDTEAIRQAFEGAQFGTNRQQVNNLVLGEILAFETDNKKTGGSKRGLIQIKSITAGAGETGRLEIEVLVEQ